MNVIDSSGWLEYFAEGPNADFFAPGIENIATYGFHGAQEPVEGAVWRVERNRLINRKKGGERRRVVDFLVKYVRPDKIDGKYLDQEIWNHNKMLPFSKCPVQTVGRTTRCPRR